MAAPSSTIATHPQAREFTIVLVDLSRDMVRAFQDAFAKCPRVRVVHGRFEELDEFDCMTSAANSFGLMDGGIDAAITRFFPSTLQRTVQRHIAAEFECEQPVGTSFIAPTGDAAHPWLAHTPTMRVPYSVQGTDYPYLAMKALLTAVRKHNEKALAAAVAASGGSGGGSSASATAAERGAGSDGSAGAGGSVSTSARKAPRAADVGAGAGAGAAGSGARSGTSDSGAAASATAAAAHPPGFIRTVAVSGLATGYGRVSFNEAARQMAVAYRAFLNPQPAHLMSWDFASVRQHEVGYGGLPGFARFAAGLRQQQAPRKRQREAGESGGGGDTDMA